MEIANFVFPIRLSRTGAGIFTSTCGITGRAGKFSLAIPTSLYFFLSLTISTQWFSSSLNLISPSGSNRTSSRSFFAGIVPAPSFLTFASHVVRTLNSRSVAVMVTRPSRASTSRFDRIGIVVLRSTTPCVVVSSFNRADLLTLNSIAWLSSRTVPVEDIYTFPGSLIRCCVLYSFFASGESLTNAIIAFYVWKLVGNFSRPVHPPFQQTSSKPENSQLQLQQQEIFSYCSYCPLTTDLSFAVMMSIVHLWKPPE